MKRGRISSRTNVTRVQLNYPTIDANKRYALTVEKLDVPAMNSLIVNETLFTVERRLNSTAFVDVDYTVANYSLLGDDTHTTFTARNVQTASQLLYQLNAFFHDMSRRIVSAPGLVSDGRHQYTHVGTALSAQAGDWYSHNFANADDIQLAIQATIRPDGRLGIRFSEDGAKVFVLRLTDAGKHLFGKTRRYIAINVTEQFDTGAEYDVTAAGVLSVCPLPAQAALTAAGGYETVFTKSLFSHLSYRNELVLDTSLPLNTVVECDGNKSHYKRQLASYRFPSTEPTMRYDHDGRHLEETGVTKFTFETSRNTHNTFIISGTELQLFNLYLITRNYEYKNLQYVQKDTPYPLLEDEYYTVQLAIKQIA